MTPQSVETKGKSDGKITPTCYICYSNDDDQGMVTGFWFHKNNASLKWPLLIIFCGFLSTRILLYFPFSSFVRPCIRSVTSHIFSIIHIWCLTPNKLYIFSKPITLPMSQVLPSTNKYSPLQPSAAQYSPEQPTSAQYTPILPSIVQYWSLQSSTVR